MTTTQVCFQFHETSRTWKVLVKDATDASDAIEAFEAVIKTIVAEPPIAGSAVATYHVVEDEYEIDFKSPNKHQQN